MNIKTTGKLIKLDKEVSYGWCVPTYQTVYICEDCKTVYPKIGKYNIHTGQIDRHIMCNGHKIMKCPWCRPDSRPWTHGRGK